MSTGLYDLSKQMLMHPFEENSTGQNLAAGGLREEEVRLTVEQGYDVLQRYFLVGAKSYALILKHPESGDIEYHVIEPHLTEEEKETLRELKTDIRNRVLHQIQSDSNDVSEILRSESQKKLTEYPGYSITDHQFEKIWYYIKRDLLGYQKMEPLMRDDNLEEISCNGTGVPIHVFHRDYDDHIPTNVYYRDSDDLDRFISKLAQSAGKDISAAQPTQGTDLPDGSRAQINRAEVADESNYTIRKFREDPFTPTELILSGTCTSEELAYLWILIENYYNGLVVGGTGTGKTTKLNALSMFIPPRKKIVSIEDTRELKLPHENRSALVTRESHSSDEVQVDMQDLLTISLRMRPDYIPVGEIRDENGKALFEAMSTGHTAYSTLHADSMTTVLNRLREEPIDVPDAQIAETGFVCVQVTSSRDDQTIRRTKNVYEVLSIDKTGGGTPEVEYREMFKWDQNKDEIVGDPVRNSIHFETLQEESGMPVYEEYEERKQLLDYLTRETITEYDDVVSVLQGYMIDPELVMTQVEADNLNIGTIRQAID